MTKRSKRNLFIVKINVLQYLVILKEMATQSTPSHSDFQIWISPYELIGNIFTNHKIFLNTLESSVTKGIMNLPKEFLVNKSIIGHKGSVASCAAVSDTARHTPPWQSSHINGSSSVKGLSGTQWSWGTFIDTAQHAPSWRSSCINESSGAKGLSRT